MAVALDLDFIARCGDFEPPVDRSLTVTALSEVVCFFLIVCWL